LQLTLVVVTLIVLAAPAAAADFELKMGDEVIPVSPTLLNGMNYGNWMILFDLLPEYKELNIPLLRFPAGNYGDDNFLSAASLRLLMMAADALDAIPMVQHNVFRGDVEEAVKWVRHVKEEGLPIRYWFIGNEPDLYGPNRGGTHWTPEYYANKFREYAIAIKEVDPDAIVIGPVVTGTPNEVWIKTFLRIAGDLVDVLAWQWYPSDGSMPEEQALATAKDVGDHIRMFRAWTKDPEINPLGWEREIPLFISEFGLSWRTRHARLLTDMTAGLWLAEVWGEMVHAELEYAAYFALQGTGGHGLFDVALWPRPTYFVHWMLAQMGHSWRSVEYSAPSNVLKAYGSEVDDECFFLLINKQHDPLTVSIPEAVGPITCLWIDDEEQHELKEQIWEEGEVTLAAYSVSLIKFRRN